MVGPRRSDTPSSEASSALQRQSKPQSQESESRGDPAQRTWDSQNTFSYTAPFQASSYHQTSSDAAGSPPLTGRSPSSTAADEETPWWLYKTGFSPSPASTSTSHFEQQNFPSMGQPPSMTPSALADYGQFLSPAPPFYLDSPTQTTQSSHESFAWHNNATSYREFMANQNAQATGSYVVPPFNTNQYTQQNNTLHHHQSMPYIHASTQRHFGVSPGPRSAPLPDQSSLQHQQQMTDLGALNRSWQQPQHETSTQNSFHIPRPVLDGGSSHPGSFYSNTTPGLTFDSGSRVTSTESIPTTTDVGTPWQADASHVGVAGEHQPGMCALLGFQDASTNAHDKPQDSDTSQLKTDVDGGLNNTNSFDKFLHSRPPPITLHLPENRKRKRMLRR